MKELDWTDLDQQLLKASFGAPKDKLEATQAIQFWYEEISAVAPAAIYSNLLEHVERRVAYIHEYFGDEFDQDPDSRWAGMRLAHTAAQTALARNSRESLRLSNYALTHLLKDAENEGNKFRWPDAEDADDIYMAAGLPSNLAQGLKSSEEVTTSRRTFMATDILRVRALALGLDATSELLRRADANLGVALELLAQAQESASRDEIKSHFLISDVSVRASQGDLVQEQRISLLQEKSIINLKLGVLEYRSRVLHKSGSFSEASRYLEEYWQIKKLISSLKGSDRVEGWEPDQGSILDEGKLSSFFNQVDWSKSAKEAMEVIKLLPALTRETMRDALKLVLHGKGMTVAKWKEILEYLFDEHWHDTDIQKIIADLMGQYTTADPKKKDAYISVWLEAVSQRADSKTMSRDDAVIKVLSALRITAQSNLVIHKTGPSVRALYLHRERLEKMAPSCKGLIEEIIQLVESV